MSSFCKCGQAICESCHAGQTTTILNKWLTDDRLKPNEKLVLIFVQSYNYDRQKRYSARYLNKTLGIAKNIALSCLEKLESLGFIKKTADYDKKENLGAAYVSTFKLRTVEIFEDEDEPDMAPIGDTPVPNRGHPCPKSGTKILYSNKEASNDAMARPLANEETEKLLKEDIPNLGPEERLWASKMTPAMFGKIKQSFSLGEIENAIIEAYDYYSGVSKKKRSSNIGLALSNWLKRGFNAKRSKKSVREIEYEAMQEFLTGVLDGTIAC